MTCTLVILKPDCVSRELCLKVTNIIEDQFAITRMKSCWTLEDQVKEHYKEHEGKPFFKDLVDFMKDEYVYVLLCEHRSDPENTISLMRKLVGPTDGSDIESIRGQFKLPNVPKMKNLIHASDFQDSFLREKDIWFGSDSKK